jgi:hypothetical protein
LIYVAIEYLGKSLTEMAKVVKMELGFACRVRMRGREIVKRGNILNSLGIRQ